MTWINSNPTSAEESDTRHIRTIIELISATTTQTGLTVQAVYDPTWYAKGQKVSDTDFNTLPLQPHDWHGEWNYDLTPP